MRSPFQSEPEAYRFVFLTIGAFTAIAVASLLGGAWVGVPVWAVATAATALFYLRKGWAGRQVRTAPAHVGPVGERRVLVIACETLTDKWAREEIARAGAGRNKMLVVCPALTSAVRHWASDVDGAITGAQRRLDESLGELRAAGIEARGEIGDEDPVRAIEDALRTFGADEIIIATHPEGRLDGRERNVVALARERFAVPITHVVIDAATGARP